MITKEEFASNLKRAIADSGKTQAEVAQLAGITEPMLSDYLRGKTLPRSGTAEKLAKVLNTSYNWLYYFEPIKYITVHKSKYPEKKVDTKIVGELAKTLNESMHRHVEYEKKYYQMIEAITKLNVHGLEKVIELTNDLSTLYKYSAQDIDHITTKKTDDEKANE